MLQRSARNGQVYLVLRTAGSTSGHYFPGCARNCFFCRQKKQKLATKKVKIFVDTAGAQEYNGKAVAQEGTLKKGLGQQRNLEKRTA